MKYSLVAFGLGVVSVCVGVFLWLGLAATLIVAGVVLVAAGLLIDLESE